MIVQNYVRFDRINRHAVESSPAVYVIAVCIDFGSFPLQNVNGQIESILVTRATIRLTYGRDREPSGRTRFSEHVQSSRSLPQVRRIVALGTRMDRVLMYSLSRVKISYNYRLVGHCYHGVYVDQLVSSYKCRT